jgi:hypothetical protein
MFSHARLARAIRSYAQKGVSMRVPEATALVDAIMDGKVHRDYVVVGGQQCARHVGAVFAARRRHASPRIP